MIEWALEPLRYSFFLRGLLASILVGAVCAIIGSYVVLRGMAFMGDALAHAILPGVAVAYLLGGGAQAALFWGGMIAGIGTALGIGAITREGHIREDTAIGVLFAGMFALGIALISSTRSYSLDLTHFLFGNVLGITPEDLYLSALFGSLIVLIVLAFYKEFLVISFDPILATTLRLPTAFLSHLMLILIAVTVVVALQTVGIALTVAMLVTPAAAAHMLTRRLPAMMALAALIGAGSGMLGLYLSFYANIASGAAIVLTCTLIFALVLLLAPRRGVLRRRHHLD